MTGTSSDDTASERRDIAGINPDVPHPARVYDYFLGGKDNYEADRVAVEAGIKAFPKTAESARAARAFLRRVVRFMAAEAGIRQFLDIGTGLPSGENVHQVAQSIAPDSRIVYADNDPIVLAHAHALLKGSPEGVIDYLDADLRNPEPLNERNLDAPLVLRDHAQVTSFFDGLDLIEPGVVQLSKWRPQTETESAAAAALWGGVARKPAEPS